MLLYAAGRNSCETASCRLSPGLASLASRELNNRAEHFADSLFQDSIFQRDARIPALETNFVVTCQFFLDRYTTNPLFYALGWSWFQVNSDQGFQYEASVVNSDFDDFP